MGISVYKKSLLTQFTMDITILHLCSPPVLLNYTISPNNKTRCEWMGAQFFSQ